MVSSDENRAVNDKRQIVVFSLGTQLYGLPIASVQEIIRVTSLVKIPKSPEFVEGVINLRGRIIPVIDLRKKFDMPAIGDGKNCRIIIVEMENSCAGCLVDMVKEVMNTEGLEVRTPPKMFELGTQDFFKGIIEKGASMVVLLDIERIFSGEEKKVIEQVVSQ